MVPDGAGGQTGGEATVTPQRWEIAEFVWGGEGRGDVRRLLYSHRPTQDNIGRDERAAILKQLGDEGWELCGFTAPTPAYVIYAFKRPLS